MHTQNGENVKRLNTILHFMNAVLHPTYFPNVSSLAALYKSEALYFEFHDNYQKQSFRNRTEIYGANGKLPLSIPVNYTQKQRQLFCDVVIANNYNWQNEHLKALHSAYESSPFFEFYIDQIKPLYTQQFNKLITFNLATIEVFLNCLDLKIEWFKTTCYKPEPNNKIDFRKLVKPNIKINTLPYYTQVFTQKHGFISNLSGLDLLFNEGPNTLLYLNQINYNNIL